MRVYLVRHGRSSGNLPGRMTGWSDHSLTKVGVQQARRVAARLRPLGPMPVITSDLPRALETARIVAGRWPDGERLVRPDPRLREIKLGAFEGRSWEEFTADAGLAARFEADPYTTPLPDGESLAMVSDRAVAAFEDALVAAGATEPDETEPHETEPDETGDGPRPAVCIVAHDSPIRAIVNHVLKVPPERHWTLSTSHGGLSLLEVTDGWVSVRFFNDTSHLRCLDRSIDGTADGEVPVRPIERLPEGDPEP